MVYDAWKNYATNESVEKIEIQQDPHYRFDLNFLNDLAPENCTIFAAVDNRFLNFKRLELMGECKMRGFKMPAFIHPNASVSAGSKISDNSFVDAGTIVNAHVVIQHNVFVGAAACIEHGVKVHHSAWLENKCHLGRSCIIERHTTIGKNIVIGDEVKVGAYCVVDVPGRYAKNIAPKTYYHSLFHEPIITFN